MLPFSFDAKDWANIVIALIIGWLISYIFYRKALSKKGLSFTVKRELLVYREGNHPNELEVFYAGRAVQSVLKLTLYVWNSGNQAIIASDLDTRVPLHIAFPDDVTPLQISVVQQTREANHVTVNVDQTINFDYLNPHDGFVVDVFAEGPRANRRGLLNLSGDIVGIAKAPSAEEYEFSRGRSTNWLFVVLGVMMFGTLGSKFWETGMLTWNEPSVTRFAGIAILSLMMLGAGLFVVVGLATLFVTKRIPQSLLSRDFSFSVAGLKRAIARTFEAS